MGFAKWPKPITICNIYSKWFLFNEDASGFKHLAGLWEAKYPAENVNS